MAEKRKGKRKDKKGRVLRAGERQRSNGAYEYRYQDEKNVTRSIYAKTLDELREKEEQIQKDLSDGIDIEGSNITVSELVDLYMGLKRKLGPNSIRAYQTAVNRIKDDPFGSRKICSVKKLDAKRFYVKLHDSGLKQNTIGVYHAILRPAFEMAVDDDLIRKNPFKFTLADVLPNDAELRNALTKEQQAAFLTFIREHGSGNYYDDIVILLECGLRVSELYGLTKKDIDFEKRCIHVNRQLCRTAERPYFIKDPKTSCGIRCIPMSETAYQTFRHIFENRKQPKIEWIVDGYSGFLFLDKNGRPKTAMHLQNYLRCMEAKYVKLHGKKPPHVSPHVLRHTFCTNMQQAGIDVKSLQYLMGHSHASVTLDVYTHTDYNAVERAFHKAAASM